MYRFNTNRHYNWPIVAPIVALIINQTRTLQSIIPTGDQKYDRRGHESPSGYGSVGIVGFSLKGCYNVLGVL